MEYQDAYNLGQEYAQSVVDYIGSHPRTFSNAREREFWRGFMDAERKRCKAGLRSRDEFNRLEARFNAASVKMEGN